MVLNAANVYICKNILYLNLVNLPVRWKFFRHTSLGVVSHFFFVCSIALAFRQPTIPLGTAGGVQTQLRGKFA